MMMLRETRKCLEDKSCFSECEKCFSGQWMNEPVWMNTAISHCTAFLHLVTLHFECSTGKCKCLVGGGFLLVSRHTCPANCTYPITIHKIASHSQKLSLMQINWPPFTKTDPRSQNCLSFTKIGTLINKSWPPFTFSKNTPYLGNKSWMEIRSLSDQ